MIINKTKTVVTCCEWKTVDGKIFCDFELAKEHEESLNENIENAIAENCNN